MNEGYVQTYHREYEQPHKGANHIYFAYYRTQVKSGHTHSTENRFVHLIFAGNKPERDLFPRQNSLCLVKGFRKIVKSEIRNFCLSLFLRLSV
jgi:hypothetical protein